MLFMMHNVYTEDADKAVPTQVPDCGLQRCPSDMQRGVCCLAVYTWSRHGQWHQKVRAQLAEGRAV